MAQKIHSADSTTLSLNRPASPENFLPGTSGRSSFLFRLADACGNETPTPPIRKKAPALAAGAIQVKDSKVSPFSICISPPHPLLSHTLQTNHSACRRLDLCIRNNSCETTGQLLPVVVYVRAVRTACCW